MNEQKEFCQSMDKGSEQLIKMAFANAKTCGAYMEGQVRKETPVDMGLLRAANTHDVGVDHGQIEVVLANTMHYAPYVHQGTGIYAEEGDGRQTPWVYVDAKGVGHTTKGQKANPFMRRAVEKNKDKIERLLGKGV